MSNSPRNSPCAPAAGWKVTASMPVISFSDASARAYTSRQPCASFTSCNCLLYTSEIKLICDKYDINIPFPQIVVNQPTVIKQASEWEKEQARKFTEEQRELSANIMNEDEDER